MIKNCAIKIQFLTLEKPFILPYDSLLYMKVKIEPADKTSWVRESDIGQLHEMTLGRENLRVIANVV